MNRHTGIIIAIIILAFGGLIGISILQHGQKPNTTKPANSSTITVASLEEIAALAKQNNYDDYSLASIIPASAASGNRPENIKGDPEAPVKIYEYADYQCEHCATLNPYINQLLAEYGGKVALVYRGYIMPYHAQNGPIAAAAANAAALQGYWTEMKDTLFANQDEWFYAKPADMPGYLDKYFLMASSSQGDLTKFHQDMQSEAVKQKIAFDYGLYEKADLQWTPIIFIEDKFMSQKEIGGSYDDFIQALRNEINRRLQAAAKSATAE